MSIIGTIVIGFIVGLLARALKPGDDKLGIIMTTVLGVVGSLGASFIGQKMGWYLPGAPAGWIAADLDPSLTFENAHRANGHATLFRDGNKRRGIQQFAPGLLAVHKKLKRAFDPHGILGPGRIHADF